MPVGLATGDIVQIAPLEDIHLFMEAYGAEFGVVPPEVMADRLASVLHMPGPRELDEWDGYISVLVQGLGEMKLPFAMLCTPEDEEYYDQPNYMVEEAASEVLDGDQALDDHEYSDVHVGTTYAMPSPDRRQPSYDVVFPGDPIVGEMAAVSIQQAFRRHVECRPAINMRRISSQESLVMDMAADTIKSGLRSMVATKNSQQQQQQSLQAEAEAEAQVKRGTETKEAEHTDMSEPAAKVTATRPATKMNVRMPKAPAKDIEDKGHMGAGAERTPLPPLPASEAKAKVATMTGGAKSSGKTGGKTGGKRASGAKAGGGKSRASKSVDAKADRADSKALALVVGESDDEGEGDSSTSAKALPEMRVAQSVDVTTLPHAQAKTAPGAAPRLAEAKGGVGARRERGSKNSGSESASASASASTSKGRGTAAPAPTLRVIDRAFLQAKRGEASSVWLQHNELLILLDALGVSVRDPAEDGASGGGGGAGTNEDSMGVEISLRKPAALAAALSTFARDSDVLHAAESEFGPFSLAKDHAELALGHLNALVDGNWAKARASIMRALSCGSGSGKGWARPSEWADEDMSAVLAVLQLPGPVRALSAREFLALGRRDLRTSMGLASSLLQARCLVYQRTLLLLDRWWELGDVHPADSLPREEVAEAKVDMTRSMSKDTLLALAGRQAAKPLPPADASATAALALAKKNRPIAGQKNRPVNGIRTKLRAGVPVQLDTADTLLDFWIPLNRAYGWGLPVDVLSSLANVLGGLKGRISPSVDCIDISAERGEAKGSSEDGAPAPLQALKGAQWVLLESIPGISVDALLEDVGSCGVASPRHKCVAIPTACLKRCTAKEYAASMRLAPEDMYVGLKVCAADAETLKLCCERFDWWDRPAPEVLEVLAGRTGEVVSVNELTNVGRVGLQFVNGDGREVLDALPLEALRPVVVVDVADEDEDDNAAEEAGWGSARHLPTRSVTEMLRRAEAKTHRRGHDSKADADADTGAGGRVVFGSVREGAAGRAAAAAEAAAMMSAQGKQAPASRRPKSARAVSADAKADAVRASRDRPPSPNTRVPLKPYEYSWLRPEKVMELSAPPAPPRTAEERGLDSEQARGLTIHSFGFGALSPPKEQRARPDTSASSRAEAEVLPALAGRALGHRDVSPSTSPDRSAGVARGGAVPLRDFTADMLGPAGDEEEVRVGGVRPPSRHARSSSPEVKEGARARGPYRYADDAHNTSSPDRMPESTRGPIGSGDFGIVGEGRMQDRGSALAHNPDQKVRKQVYRPEAEGENAGENAGVKHSNAWGDNSPAGHRGPARPQPRAMPPVDMYEEEEEEGGATKGGGGRPGFSSGGKRQKSLNNSVMPFPDFENTQEGGGRPSSAVIAGKIVRGPASPRHGRGHSDDDDGDVGDGDGQGAGSVRPGTAVRSHKTGSASSRGSYSTNKQNTKTKKKKDKDKDPLNVSGVASMLAEKRQEALAKELATATAAAEAQHVTSAKALAGIGAGGGAHGAVERDTDGDIDVETPRTGRMQEEERDEAAYLSDQKRRSSRDGLAYKEKMLRKELKRMGVGVGAGAAH